MKQNQQELKFLNCRFQLFLLVFGCGIIAIFGSGCASGGIGARIGRAALEIDGSPNTTMYVEAGHIWGSLYKGLTLDVVPYAFLTKLNLLDSESLLATGSFGNLQYEFPLSFLPIPIVNTIRPYAGYGIGYLFAEAGMRAVDEAGEGRATKFVVGGYLFSQSEFRLRLEYQRLKSTVTLKSFWDGDSKLSSVDGRIFLIEMIWASPD